MEAALLTDEPLRDIARRYATSKDALARHRDSHIPPRLAKAQEAHEIAQADTLLDQVRSLQTRALSILDQAEGAGDLRTAVSAVREARATVELLAKLSGELDDRPVITLVSAPEWLTLRAVVIQALRPYPDAARAVSKALTAGEA